MKALKRSGVLLLILLFTLIVGCSKVDGKDTQSIKAPKNEGLSIDGTWKIKNIDILDEEIENKDVLLNQIGDFIIISNKKISIFNKDPQNSVTLPDYQDAGKMMSALVRTRRACRRYLNKDVDKKIIKELMGSIQYAPTGGNKRKLEFTIIDDCKEMDYFRLLVRDEMIKLANNGIYPQGFDKTSYNQMMAWEKSVRPDSIFCGAPHILIPHAPKNIPCAVQDVNMAAAYFELLCNANGLGAICMSYPLAVLGNMPNVMKLLQIPEDHYISLMVGFGYPEIRYARGVQREANGKIKRIVFTQD